MRWAADFGRRFIVFVDVEEEFDWFAPLDRAQRATTAMRAFPAAHRRFVEAGVGLTCMVDYPIATDPDAVAVLRDVAADGRSAIGAQLHPWVNPPHDEAVRPFASFPGNLPRALQAAKLAALNDAIDAAFGSRPLAFRAGRYGLGPDSWALLAAAGYRLDSSVRARYSYAAQGGPDYAAIGPGAFRAGGLIELPLTTVFTGALRGGGAGLYRALGMLPRARGAAARAGLLQRVALTPEDMPIGAALAAVDAALAAGVELLAFSFHSPSLEPGHTPYVRNAAGLAAFWRWWAAMLDRLAARGVRAASLAEVLAAAG
ncbi:polysaccharide deacetylase family protein [Sphingomonas sp.]|uniref:polysaccharide deacetylase family protein n=1 Tax=Sphingomonas sp. TaxID=28214 RepID=UPI003CC5D470